MPTARHRVAHAALPQLSEVQLCYLLDQPLPPEGRWEPFRGAISLGDKWWLVVEARQTNPDSAWIRNSAVELWRRHRDELLPLWRQGHGGRRHPLDRDPPEQPPVALASLRAWRQRPARGNGQHG